MPFFVYVLQNSDGRFYIGQTSDVELRLQRHNEGRVFWTKGRGPWGLVYSEEFGTRSEAMAKEKGLKALKSKEELRKLIAQR
jgi:putative endonuclease